MTSSIGDICKFACHLPKNDYENPQHLLSFLLLTLSVAELLKGKAMDRTFVDFITDSVMLEVADWYERHSLQIGVAKQDKCR